MQVDVKGNKEGPLVVCVHGLMGHESDFVPFADDWGKDYCLIIPNLTGGATANSGYSEIIDGEEALMYELSAKGIIKFLDENYAGKKAFFVGISFGGKICFEISQMRPDLFLGASITDVGLGPLCRTSELFSLVTTIIPSLNFEQSWPKLRKELKEKVDDRMLRILIQSHISYPDKTVEKAVWKDHASGFYDLLRSNKLENQWPKVDKVTAPIHIFKATEGSAISDDDYVEMQKLDNFNFHVIDGANHFIQINNKDEFRSETQVILDKYLK